MGKEETMWAAVGVLRAWIGKYGVPRALYTDWKNVYRRKSHVRRAVAGRSAGHAVWTHVSEAGHSHHRGQFATSQRTGGTQSRHAPGPADQETAAALGRASDGGSPTGSAGRASRRRRRRPAREVDVAAMGACEAGDLDELDRPAERAGGCGVGTAALDGDRPVVGPVDEEDRQVEGDLADRIGVVVAVGYLAGEPPIRASTGPCGPMACAAVRSTTPLWESPPQAELGPAPAAPGGSL